MGLDMMLYGIKYEKDTDVDKGVFEEVAYWRKANQIHHWFNEKFIKKQDPYGYYVIPRIDLQGLVEVCKILLRQKEIDNLDELYENDESRSEIEFQLCVELSSKHKSIQMARSLLPPDNLGCCFGSGIIDEYYWECLEDTVKMLEKALSEDWDKFFYSASW